MPRPAPEDYAPFYHTYVSKIFAEHPLAVLQDNQQELRLAMSRLDAGKADYAYAEGKWTVKQLLQHMTDTERVFAYRAMRIARGDETPLPGFDENLYAANALVEHVALQALADELVGLRETTITLFSHFTVGDLQRKGMASNSPVTVNALAFIMAGHIKHHLAILKERYQAYS